jgi:hypothetical protein
MKINYLPTTLILSIRAVPPAADGAVAHLILNVTLAILSKAVTLLKSKLLEVLVAILVVDQPPPVDKSSKIIFVPVDLTTA